MRRLSELDSKILRILLEDGRTGYDEMAKACGEPKNKVWKRCKAMEKRGVIKGATTQVNFEKFGFAAVATLLLSIKAERLDRLRELTEKLTEIRAYRQYNSVYNVRAFTILKDLNQLDLIKQLIKQKLPTMGLKSYIWAGVRNSPENLSLAFKNEFKTDLKAKFQPQTNIDLGEFEIDECDRQILNKLTMDGRMSFTKIAKEIGLSTDTVVKKYHRLRNNNAMKVTIQIDPKVIGYSAILDCYVAFTTENGSTNVVVNSLSKIPDVVTLIKISGDYDIQFTAMVKDEAHSFELQDQISNITGITKMEAGSRKIPDAWPTPQQHITTF